MCFSDCPKHKEDPNFKGPAACLAAYRHIHYPQEADPTDRLKKAIGPGGVYDCDRHANCIRVCPKDCRPMRAIVFLQRRAEKEELAEKDHWQRMKNG